LFCISWGFQKDYLHLLDIAFIEVSVYTRTPRVPDDLSRNLRSKLEDLEIVESHFTLCKMSNIYKVTKSHIKFNIYPYSFDKLQPQKCMFSRNWRIVWNSDLEIIFMSFPETLGVRLYYKIQFNVKIRDIFLGTLSLKIIK
jgi:hypothetical protein